MEYFTMIYIKCQSLKTLPMTFPDDAFRLSSCFRRRISILYGSMLISRSAEQILSRFLIDGMIFDVSYCDMVGRENPANSAKSLLDKFVEILILLR